MIQTLIQGITSEVGVTLLDASDVPVTGVPFSTPVVTYRKNGDSGFTTKTVLSGEWREVGDGLYGLTLSAAELDREGSFRLIVKGAGFERYEADFLIAADFQDLALALAEMKAALVNKVNIRDATKIFSALELRIRELEQSILLFKKRLTKAESSIGALRAQS